MTTLPVIDSLPVTLVLRVDKACSRFEAEWKAEPGTGSRPRPADYLEGAAEPERSVLAEELIRLDVYYRRLNGEAPRAEDYTPLFSGPAPDWLAEAVAAPEEGFFGGYELLEEIGRAGMGVVYKVRQRYPPRVVALKTIRAGRHASPAEVERSFREVKSVAELEHPNIVPIYEAGEHRGRHYFTMRWLDGGSLAQHVKSFGADHRAAARLLATVARAVHYAHQRGIRHRDLKPANILLESRPDVPVVRWAPYVADFGLAARATAGDEPASAPPRGPGDTTPGNGRLTEGGTVLGTAPYMAPEQAAGERLLSTAIDVYGLGAVLYELLTGRPPFKGETVRETLEQVKTRQPPHPRQLNPRVDRELGAICLMCLEKEPGQRYPSAEALAEDLERWLRGEPVLAYPVGRPRRLGKWAKRRPAVAALLLALALLAGFGVGAVAWEEAQTHQAYHAAESQLYITRVLLADRRVTEGQFDRAEEILDRCPQQFRGWEWDYLKRLSHREPIVLRGHTGRVLSVEYSPDGLRLATAGWDGTARVWDAATGGLLRTMQGHAGPVHGACFSNDGRVLVTAGDDQVVGFWDAATGRLWKTEPGGGQYVTASRRNNRAASVGRARVITLWDAARGAKLWALPPLDEVVTCLALSPDGRYLAATGYNQLLRVWDTAERRELLPPFAPEKPGAFRNVFAVAFSPDGNYLAAGGETVQVWEIQTRRCRPLFGTGGLRCSRITFSPDSRHMAATYRDGLLRVWDLATGKTVLSSQRIGQNLGIDFSPDGQSLAITREREVTVQALKPPKVDPCRTLVGPTPARVCALAFGPGGRLASRASDRTVVLWDLATGRPDRTFLSPVAIPEEANLVFSGNNRLVLACDGDRLQVWDADTGRPAVVIPARNTRCCAASHDGKRLATADAGNAILLWDLETGRQVRSCERVTGEVRSLAFRPGDRQLASCGSDGTVILWDAATGKQVRTCRGHAPSFACVVFSPDGRHMASACDDSTVRVWDVDRGEVTFTFRGHDGPVAGVAFSPDGKRLASASHDGTVKLWDAGRGREVLTLKGHGGVVAGVAFSPDGLLLASCSHDGRVRVWDGTPLPKAGAP